MPEFFCKICEQPHQFDILAGRNINSYSYGVDEDDELLVCGDSGEFFAVGGIVGVVNFLSVIKLLLGRKLRMKQIILKPGKN